MIADRTQLPLLLAMLPARVRSKIEVRPPTPEQVAAGVGGCWIWTGALCAKGYGSLWWAGSAKQAHRIVFELLGGEIGTCDGGKPLQLDHLGPCGRRDCCAPEHLEPVTARENNVRANARRAEKKRRRLQDRACV